MDRPDQRKLCDGMGLPAHAADPPGNETSKLANMAFHIELIALRNATVSGLVFAWPRARTGSLVTQVIAHGLEDFLFFLPRMV